MSISRTGALVGPFRSFAVSSIQALFLKFLCLLTITETTNPAGKTAFPVSAVPPAPETEATAPPAPETEATAPPAPETEATAPPAPETETKSDQPSKQKVNNWREHAPSLWTKLLSAFTEASHDARPDVRNSACNTLVSAIRFVLPRNAVGSIVVWMVWSSFGWWIMLACCRWIKSPYIFF